MDNIHNLTIVIVTYRTDEKILTECINSLNQMVKIVVVENSDNKAFKDKIFKYRLVRSMTSKDSHIIIVDVKK